MSVTQLELLSDQSPTPCKAGGTRYSRECLHPHDLCRGNDGLGLGSGFDPHHALHFTLYTLRGELVSIYASRDVGSTPTRSTNFTQKKKRHQTKLLLEKKIGVWQTHVMKKIETVYILVNTRTANAEVAYDDYDYAVEQFKQIGIDLGLHYDPCNRLYDDQFKLNYKLETVSIFPMPTKKEAV